MALRGVVIWARSDLQEKKGPLVESEPFQSKTKVHRTGPDLRVSRLLASRPTSKGKAAQAPRSSGRAVSLSEDRECAHGMSNPFWCAYCRAGHGTLKPAAGVAER